MRIVHECQSNHGWQLVKVPSASEPGREHDVLLPPWDRKDGEGTCTCRGFEVRGTCRHLSEALASLCQWTSADPYLLQTKEQEVKHICPKCHERVRIVIYT